ncbi:DUF2806 domain-containing protein [Pseudoalteromonas sp.]|uniref:DUF2806 domain-containing protein n=1 Tax=unclassified Pseudoalteromonas TaxID=194690 RepID=UPI003F9C7BF5
MSIKAAQAKINRATIIESQLGYSISKKHRKLGEASDNRYVNQGRTPLGYQIKSDCSRLSRAQKRQQLRLIKRQQNIETIMSLAMSFCCDVTRVNSPDSD